MRVVLPASGWEMMAKVRRRAISSVMVGIWGREFSRVRLAVSQVLGAAPKEGQGGTACTEERRRQERRGGNVV